MLLEAAVSFISKISSSETRGKRAWSTAILSVFWIYCAVVLQSGGCFPFFEVVAKAETMLWMAEIDLN